MQSDPRAAEPRAAEPRADPAVHGAARTAALIALPIAVVTGALVFWLLGGFAGAGAPGSGAAQQGSRVSSAAPAPQATGPVPIAAPALDERAATVCRALLSQRPDRLRDRPARPVAGTGSDPADRTGSEQNAAYGEPPITMACGVAAPTAPPDAEFAVLSGVCWYQQRNPTATVFTTVDREVPIAVTVPVQYAEAWQWLMEFSAPIVATAPSAATVPPRCTA
ncbi:MAG TPA: DUF3515 family protein [Micromonosporaceae bacterium]|nr:DUF3515 family protein [Micromonosporaceae bacterium]